jgi:hypothetical protein
MSLKQNINPEKFIRSMLSPGRYYEEQLKIKDDVPHSPVILAAAKAAFIHLF